MADSGRSRGKGSVVWRDSELTTNLSQLNLRATRAIQAACQFESQRGRAMLKANAPWTDRTGNARNGLDASPFNDGNTAFGIVLYHQVDYGIYLETKWSGRFQVIAPTLKTVGQELMVLVSDIFSKMELR